MIQRNLVTFAIAFGVALALIMVAEFVSIMAIMGGPDMLWIFNFIASIPFIAALLACGWVVRKTSLPASLHSRIVKWIVVGAGFVGVFFLIIAILSEDSAIIQVGIVRWGVAAGAGAGAIIGIFEARAIHRAIQVERTQMRNEELEQQNEQLQKFERLVAHDLRNPLTVASAHVDFLDEEGSQDSIQKIKNAHSRMGDIIDGFLEFARTGQLVNETEEVAISNLVDSSWGSISGQEARVNIESDGVIRADPDRTLHLFENLFRNAIEHAGPDVNIHVGMLEDGFYIEDDGVGIPEEKRNEVFMTGYSTNENGTGFGLAIVKQVADAHRWNTTLTDSENGGARFEFRNVQVVRTPSASTASPGEIAS